jgi:hypothetical protein
MASNQDAIKLLISCAKAMRATLNSQFPTDWSCMIEAIDAFVESAQGSSDDKAVSEQEPVAPIDECIELAHALEQLRAIKIVEAVAAIQIGGANADIPTPFQAGYQLACEEIKHRLQTEQWNLGDMPQPMASTHTDSKAPIDERARFEAGVKQGKDFDLKLDENGEYAIHTTRMQWIGWQARARLASQVPDGKTFHEWFELTYAQFLVLPRVIMEAMPPEWQHKMTALLDELDEQFDYLPANENQYWVRVGKSIEWPYEDDDGNPIEPVLQEPDADLCNYRHPNIEHRRKSNQKDEKNES